MTDNQLSKPFLHMAGISKHYGGVTAVDNVTFACDRHSIHAILGENGAGKSTLIKIISGVTAADEGRISLDGKEVRFSSPAEATQAGIVCIFQELSLMPDLSVADNICITNPPSRLGVIQASQQYRKAEALLAQVGCEDVNPLSRVSDLPLSRRQLVEIAKALGRAPELLILDEATSALTAQDVENVFQILRTLRDQGTAVLYISHRMAEIEAIADTCTVFRNGRNIETFAQGSRTSEEIVELMIGREISQVYPPKPSRSQAQETAIAVKNLSWEDRLDNISLSVGRGEIVGLGGLDGQGQRELLLSLFGVLRGVRGSIYLNDKEVHISSPAQAKAPENGIAMIPEDRKTEGLLLPMSIRDNLTIAGLYRLVRNGIVDAVKEQGQISDLIRDMQIKTQTIDAAVATLSGGNQQKVVIAKWLMTEARIFLLMDPTRGIDVGTKQEIYALMRRLSDSGAAILFYSTDYDELIGMCDRVLILYRGGVIQELEGDRITEHNIVSASLNLDLADTAADIERRTHG